jgi:hypothetical protein
MRLKKPICFLIIFSSLLFIRLPAFARTDLSQTMANICEDLGPVQGAKCVELQREMESSNVVLDNNGAEVCALIWHWGSRNGETAPVAGLVLSCFKQVANLRISEETKDTCTESIAEVEGSIATLETIRTRVARMMSCIQQLTLPASKAGKE